MTEVMGTGCQQIVSAIRDLLAAAFAQRRQRILCNATVTHKFAFGVAACFTGENAAPERLTGDYLLKQMLAVFHAGCRQLPLNIAINRIFSKTNNSNPFCPLTNMP